MVEEIQKLIELSQETKELLPCEVNTNLKECLCCGQYKEDVETRESKIQPNAMTYSCEDCYIQIEANYV